MSGGQLPVRHPRPQIHCHCQFDLVLLFFVCVSGGGCVYVVVLLLMFSICLARMCVYVYMSACWCLSACTRLLIIYFP